ncbi:MAG TPA: hypothetical protein VF285_00400 [Castellaniella sp.]|uniref:hypothetical protein n=1 Tax=Castellaniella sp. TaxID=1955812 RepID=UPI002F079A5C
MSKSVRWVVRVAGVVLAGGLTGCAAVGAGQLVQAGYDAAKTSLSAPMSSAQAQHAREVMNSITVGQEAAPIVASMGVPPKEKSGNLQGFVCYQYAGVYSATEDAVIMVKDGKVVFYGSSTCKSEMQAINFAAGGKYATPAEADPAASK